MNIKNCIESFGQGEFRLAVCLIPCWSRIGFSSLRIVHLMRCLSAFACILIPKSGTVTVVLGWLKQHWSPFSCNTDYVFFSNAFSSELDRCCCIWHLVLLITNKPLEHDFLRKLCIKLVCEIVTKRFVFKHGQLEYTFQWVLPCFTCKLQ